MARNLLIDGEAAYLTQAAELELMWNSLPRATQSTYPLSFSAIERQHMESDAEGAERGMAGMASIKEHLRKLAGSKSIVSPAHYDEARDILHQLKAQVVAAFARNDEDRAVWDEVWPFDR